MRCAEKGKQSNEAHAGKCKEHYFPLKIKAALAWFPSNPMHGKIAMTTMFDASIKKLVQFGRIHMEGFLFIA
jgi:hypothetical protein